MFLEYLKINYTTNTIKMSGKLKAVFSDSDITKIQKLKEKRPSTKKVSKKRVSTKKVSIKKVSPKKVSKKRLRIPPFKKLVIQGLSTDTILNKVFKKFKGTIHDTTFWKNTIKKSIISYKKSLKTKTVSKKRSMKKSIRKRHSNTSPSRERIRAKRPSPSTGAYSQKIGTVMKGNDGKMYKVIKTSSGTRRWVKINF